MTIAAWNGIRGIRSTSAILDNAAAESQGQGPSYAIGYADGYDGVVTGLPTNMLLAMFTRVGDATLDGTVNFPDVFILLNSYNYNPNAIYWDQGNFNYDDTVNFADVLALIQNYGGTI